ncbi:MAG: co-chaperone GroES [Candidatus Caldatribacteriota bacterium]|jgi:chaperonin GroES|nr:co-chaperone GroES [Atribacterota bacterium]MDD3031458.1 co-chaperone GroES [Atribacterota bacterium]MDD3641034.1 co-chaperone GroES [Atribacterota bacterium]MDD4289597.1 co-chaperone GroES [Atribacterota bacterium]MDD4765218.1 co-chaperone GroES [Atribacterota bacterium]
MDIKKIKPLGDRILVKPFVEEEKTKGGIVLPDTISKEKPQVGEVLAVGPGRTNDEGKTFPMNFKKGDKVIYAKYSGTDLKDANDDDYLLLSEKDVLAILK